MNRQYLVSCLNGAKLQFPHIPAGIDGQIEAVHDMYFLYLLIAAWKTPDFKTIDKESRDQFCQLVDNKVLGDYFYECQARILEVYPEVPNNLVVDWPGLLIVQGKRLSSDERNKLSSIIGELMMHYRRLGSRRRNLKDGKPNRRNGGRPPLYAEHAKLAVRMKKENPLVENREIENAMTAAGLEVPPTKKRRQSMWNSISRSRQRK